MIDVINLQKSFGDKEILKGINVTINKGDIVAVLGPSGSGKSTFLRQNAIIAILPPLPDGKI